MIHSHLRYSSVLKQDVSRRCLLPSEADSALCDRPQVAFTVAHGLRSMGLAAQVLCCQFNKYDGCIGEGSVYSPAGKQVRTELLSLASREIARHLTAMSALFKCTQVILLGAGALQPGEPYNSEFWFYYHALTGPVV